MGIQHADKSKQPGETLIYEMEFEPGVAIGTTDTLAGLPTVTITRMSDGHDVTNDDGAHVPPIVGMLSGTASRVGNVVYIPVKGGTHGESYKITITCNTTAGEIAVEEDLIIEVKQL